MKSIFSVAAVIAACLSLVNGHGTVKAFIANGRTHNGPLEGRGSQMQSPIRQVANLNPITDAYSSNMACGASAAASAKTIANVTAGSTVQFTWTAGPSQKWPHRYGSVMLYAYRCPNNDARTCKPPTGAEWVLIDALGFDPKPNEVPAGSNPARTGWYQDRIRAGLPVSFKVPKNLQNGDYLFRHEIIALHVAMDRGAEYYPSCTQVRVTGGSNASLRSQGADFAKFPGEYNPNHPGLRINVFNNNLNAKNYKMPGPAKFVGTNQPAPASSSTRKPTSSATSAPAKTESNSPKPTSTKGLKRCPARRNARGELIKRSEWIEQEKRSKHKREHSRRLSH
jgi:hypothetical protein